MGGVRVSGPGWLNHRFMLTLMTPSAPIQTASSEFVPQSDVLYKREPFVGLAPAFQGESWNPSGRRYSGT